MRLLVVLLLALAVPASAHAGTVGLEGTELVYRSAPGEKDDFEGEVEDGVLIFGAPFEAPVPITPGAGCVFATPYVRCPLAGVTGIRLLTGDGDDDSMLHDAPVPVVVELGPGDDTFSGSGESTPSLVITAGEGNDQASHAARSGTVDLGPGDDRAQLVVYEQSAGPVAVEGGDGDDQLFSDGHSRPGVTLSGGRGNDRIQVDNWDAGPGLDIACGTGNDSTRLRLSDRPGDGCAGGLTPASTRTVSRRFAATLSAPASGSVAFRDPRSGAVLARGTFAGAAAGRLRVRLETTRTGMRRLRRDPNPKVYVVLKTRSDGDRGEARFNSRLR